jgi:phage-related protein
MKSVGRGLREIKLSESGQFRVFYVTRRKDSIVVLHAFAKKTQRTSKGDIATGKQRLEEVE